MGLCPSRGCSRSKYPVYNETPGTIHLKRTPLIAGNAGYRIRSFVSNEVRDVVGLWNKTAVRDRQVSWFVVRLDLFSRLCKLMNHEGGRHTLLCYSGSLLPSPGGLRAWFPEPSMQKPSQAYTTEPQIPRRAVLTVVP